MMQVVLLWQCEEVLMLACNVLNMELNVMQGTWRMEGCDCHFDSEITWVLGSFRSRFCNVMCVCKT